MDPLITIEITPLDEGPYDLVEMLTEFTKGLEKDPLIRGFILRRESGGHSVDLGMLWLTTNCTLVHN